MKNTYTLLIHGGVGTILKQNMTPEKEQAYLAVLKESVQAGEAILKAGGSALDATEAAVVVMEDSVLFNAGRGSVFSHEGKNEMDASIMCGKTGLAGAVTGVNTIKNPIKASKLVMQKSDHVMLLAAGAEEFAKEHKCDFESPSYFSTQNRLEQLEMAKQSDGVFLDHSGDNEVATNANMENGYKKFGTVGAVALDMDGNIAAATSTGGMTNKRYGRIGDTPIIGAGTYANNNTCAVSGTGHGEFFIRNVVCYDISALMEYKHLSVAAAADEVINKKLANIEGEGGVIAIDVEGNYTFSFNTEGMYRGLAKKGEEIKVEIYK